MAHGHRLAAIGLLRGELGRVPLGRGLAPQGHREALGVVAGGRREAPAGCGDGRDVVASPRHRQVEHVAPGPGQASSFFAETHTRARSTYRLANYTARIFDAIWIAGK